MKAVLAGYSLSLLFLFTIVIAVMNYGSYKDNLRDCIDAKNEAEHMLQTDLCKNLNLRTAVGRFDRCKDANRTASISPYEQAFYDTSRDILCGKSGCSPVIVQIINKLWMVWTVFIVVVALIVLSLSFGIVRCARAREDSRQISLTLPHVSSQQHSSLFGYGSNKKLE